MGNAPRAQLYTQVFQSSPSELPCLAYDEIISKLQSTITWRNYAHLDVKPKGSHNLFWSSRKPVLEVPQFYSRRMVHFNQFTPNIRSTKERTKIHSKKKPNQNNFQNFKRITCLVPIPCAPIKSKIIHTKVLHHGANISSFQANFF